MGGGPPTLCAFQLGEPGGLSRDQTSHVARTARHCRHSAPATAACSQRRDLSAARTCEPALFPPSQGSSCRHGLGAGERVAQDAFDCAEILVHRQESLRRGKRFWFVAAPLGHPFTHRSCPLRHECVGPPRRADSPPFERFFTSALN
jgi:hypothetical protein